MFCFPINYNRKHRIIAIVACVATVVCMIIAVLTYLFR